MVSFADGRSALSGSRCRAVMAAPARPASLIEERTDIAFASVTAKRGKHFMLVNAVNTAFGVALPDGPRRATVGGVTFAGTGPDQWIASAEGAEAAGLRRARARAHRPVRRGVGPVDARLVLRLSAVRACAMCSPRACRSTCTRKRSSQATSRTRWSPISACRSTCSTKPTYQLTAPRSMAGSFWSWLSASAAEFGYDVVTRMTDRSPLVEVHCRSMPCSAPRSVAIIGASSDPTGSAGARSRSPSAPSGARSYRSTRRAAKSRGFRPTRRSPTRRARSIRRSSRCRPRRRCRPRTNASPRA